jgi:Sugar phosphate isomerases/epimerases
MKTCFSTLGCPEWSFAEIVSVASDLGFDGIEVRGVQNELYAPAIDAFSPAHIGATREKLSRLSLSIPCLASSCDLNSEDVLDSAKAYVDTASALGAPYIRLLADKNPAPSLEIHPKNIAANISEIAEYAQGRGVMPLIETNGFYAKTKTLGMMFSEMKARNVGILYDIHHPYRYFNESPEYTVKNLAPYIRHVHIKDSVMQGGSARYRIVGEGDIPVGQIIALLEEAGYKGFYSLEWVKRWDLTLEEPGIAFAQYKSFMDSLK